jgi:cytochrome c oxidase subunit 2
VPFRGAFSVLFHQNTIIAEVVFGLVLAVTAVAIAMSWHRKRHGTEPSRKEKSLRLELSYIGGLLGIACFLIISSFVQNARDFPDAPDPAMQVQVTAYQWCWQFSYPGTRVIAGGQCGGGKLPTLVLPTGRTVRFDVTSRDVVHGFWIPYLKFKIYAYPGHVNTFDATFYHPGRHIGRCAVYCGLLHYEMDFNVQLLPPAQFDRWLRARGGSPAALRRAA